MDEPRVERLLAERARLRAATPARVAADFEALARTRERDRRLRRVTGVALAAAALLAAVLLWRPFAGSPEPELRASVALLDESGRELGGGVRGGGPALPAPARVLVEVSLAQAGHARAILLDAAGGLHLRPEQQSLALAAGRAQWIEFDATLFALRDGAGELDWLVLAAPRAETLAELRLPDAPLPAAGEERADALQRLALELGRDTGTAAVLRGIRVEAPR